MLATTKPPSKSSPAPPAKWASRSSIKIDNYLQPRSLTTAEHRVLGYKRGVAFIAKRLRGTGLAKIGVASMRRQPSLTPDFVPSVTLNIEVEEAAPGKRPRSVLLLEDRADFRSILREYLLSCSYQVTSVRSGVEGLREIK